MADVAIKHPNLVAPEKPFKLIKFEVESWFLVWKNSQ
jgi:hypothetical protein